MMVLIMTKSIGPFPDPFPQTIPQTILQNILQPIPQTISLNHSQTILWTISEMMEISMLESERLTSHYHIQMLNFHQSMPFLNSLLIIKGPTKVPSPPQCPQILRA